MRHGLVINDSHCGHEFGFTPPEYWRAESDDPKKHAVRLWEMNTHNWVKKKAEQIGHLDHLIGLGDLIEGDGDRSGGTELITTDRIEQAGIALKLMRLFDADRYTIIEGTNSHTGFAEQYERLVAEPLGTRLQAHAWLEHAGCVIDLKHHIGSSSTPGAIPPALTRERVWNLLWAEHELQPKARVFIRGHLHKFFIAGDEDFIAIISPSLHGWTRYGGTRLSKTISYGMLENLRRRKPKLCKYARD